MGKIFKTLVTAFFLASVFVGFGHNHSEHMGDLHKSHSPCAVCANSGRIQPSVLPQGNFTFSALQARASTPLLEPASGIPSREFHQNLVRAPPQ